MNMNKKIIENLNKEIKSLMNKDFDLKKSLERLGVSYTQHPGVLIMHK